MHGIERIRKLDEPSPSEVRVRRIVVRYSNGRVLNFIPEAGRELFSEDDMLELVKVLEHAYSNLEWVEVASRSTD